MKTQITVYTDVTKIITLDEMARKINSNRNALINLAIEEFLKKKAQKN